MADLIPSGLTTGELALAKTKDDTRAVLARGHRALVTRVRDPKEAKAGHLTGRGWPERICGLPINRASRRF